MKPESVTKAEAETASPEHNQSGSEGKGSVKGRQHSKSRWGGILFSQSNETTDNVAVTGDKAKPQNGVAQFPPPKTDKPRPHVCGTCSRSFARLEHLKRHERSHTKEKPFECPECTRCFARRDLLLRHQQKLHATNPASSRPRAGRRESVTGATVPGTSNRVRKNSMANNGGMSGMAANSVRPRANTISHIDLSTLGLVDVTNANPSLNRMNALGLGAGVHNHGHNHSASMSGMPNPMGFDYRGMSTAMGNHGNLAGLHRIDTHAVNNMDISNSLRTAPAVSGFGGFDLDQLFSPGTTINPAQLHFGGNNANANGNTMMPQMSSFTNTQPTIDEHDDFGWMRNWSMQNMVNGVDNNEDAIEDSSPSRISSGDSPGDYTDSMANSNVAMSMQSNSPWSQSDVTSQRTMSAGHFQMEALSSGLPNLDATFGSASPGNLFDHPSSADHYFNEIMMQQNLTQQAQARQKQHEALLMQQDGGPVAPHHIFQQSISNYGSDSPSLSSSSMGGSARQSSVTSASTDSITDSTRQALLASLSLPSVFGTQQRKYSQPAISSPLSPTVTRHPVHVPSLPSTADIRKYVDAFIQFAHPHIPVTHIPTLTFDTLDFASSIRNQSSQSQHNNHAQTSIMGGGGCLILAMAAIGALYEYDHMASKELFESSKKMLSLYLEERRKADMNNAQNGGASGDGHAPHTPLWLVHAMLLNVIYGHQCGDKLAADIASSHCAALVALARAADLAQPSQESSPSTSDTNQDGEQGDVQMGDGHASAAQEVDLQTQ